MKWIHLSDLHFQFDGYGFQTNTLRKSLLRKIKEVTDKQGSFDYVFVTGDILHKGNSDSNAVNKIKTLINKIAETSNCDLEHVIICPGNHDLKRTKARKQALDFAIENIKKTGTLNYNGFEPLILSTNERFNEINEEITGRALKSEETHYCIETEHVNIYVLNTAVFSGQTYPGQKDEKRYQDCNDNNLYVCDQELFDLEKYDSEEKLNIVLAHHGIECFENSQQEQFKTFLNEIHADIYLCGHVHKSLIATLDSVNDGAQQFSCGGLFVDDYNSPSFIIGEFDPYRLEIVLQNYQFVKSVGEWRLSNILNKPYDERGMALLIPKRFAKLREARGISNGTYGYAQWNKDKFLKKLSIGLDRDKDFFEIRERAKKHVTILGAGMSKLSKYALEGPGSLKTLLNHVSIDLLMLDPSYLEDKKIADELEKYFGIPKFADQVKMSYEILEEYCKEHNSSPKCKNKITLSVYSTLPTMSAVMIDEDSNGAEAVVEFFGFHSGETRVLMSIRKTSDDTKRDVFSRIYEHICEMKENCAREVVK